MEVVGIKYQGLALLPEPLLVTDTDPAFSLRQVQAQVSRQDEIGVIRMRLDAGVGALPSKEHLHSGGLRRIDHQPIIN